MLGRDFGYRDSRRRPLTRLPLLGSVLIFFATVFCRFAEDFVTGTCETACSGDLPPCRLMCSTGILLGCF